MNKEKRRFSNAINVSNKKARRNYELIEQLTAGMMLKGSEIKSVREGNVQLNDAFCYFANGVLYVKNMHIAPYKEASFNPPDSRRERVLLLRKREARAWQKKVEEKGLSIIPLRTFVSGRGWAKLDISLARGKKHYDKREDIKRKDTEKALNRLKKRYLRGGTPKNNQSGHT